MPTVIVSNTTIKIFFATLSKYKSQSYKKKYNKAVTLCDYKFSQFNY